MQSILATFEDGVFKPAQPLDLPARSEVRIIFELVTAPPLVVGELNEFLRQLPKLGDDAEEFARDVREIRAEFPAEPSAWES